MLTIQFDTDKNCWTVSNKSGPFASSKRCEVLTRRYPDATIISEEKK